MILILILTVAVLVLICIFGFRTRKIQVSGNVYYGEGTITNWIEKDPLSVNSLYLLGKYTFDKGELPSGVESLKVSLKNPWTVAVTVVEKSMLGYVDYDEAMLYFDEQGIATLRSAKQIEGVPYIEGLSFEYSKSGNRKKCFLWRMMRFLRNWQRHPDISEKMPCHRSGSSAIQMEVMSYYISEQWKYCWEMRSMKSVWHR